MRPDHRTRPLLVDVLHNRFTAWIVLFASLLITLIAWRVSNNAAESRAQERFNFQVEEAQFAIEKRMLDYQQVLRGGLALFVASQSVERDEWHNYVKTLQLDKNYPGIQGVGYSLWIEAKDKDNIEKRVRAEGYPEFTIKPTGERDHYTSIIYLEPFDARNRRAFGYDMYSETMRRQAMERSRDQGEPSMSGKVKLVQETQTDIQPGFLIYLPHYSKESTTVEERRANLRGYVYSAFRIQDLMQGILGHGLPEVAFEIYDGDASNPDNFLYDSDGTADGTHTHSHDAESYSSNRTLTIAGHDWRVNYRSTPALAAAVTTNQPLMVAIGGVAIDLLLFYIIISLSRLRQRADRLAEERMVVLRESEQHFKTITDTAHDGIITSNSDCNISYCNRASADIFGYNESELIGRPIAELFDDEVYRNTINQIFEHSETGAPVTKSSSIEISGKHRNGTIIPLELSVATWHVDGHRFATSIMRDITERKRIERMKNEFISTVSHELRTPLTSIRGSLGLVSGGAAGEISEMTRTLVDTAARNCERLTRLINDILDVEKMESGSVEFNFTTQPLSTLIKTAVEQNQAVAAGIRIIVDSGDDLQVNVDVDRFQQVMTNLLANAIKFSPEEGLVTLSCKQHNEMVRITIADQGPGIPNEFRNRIFQKFAQADSSDSRQKGGTGLGLSIVKNIVERFGGQVGFESTREGSRFYFDLPIHQIKKSSPN